MICLRPINWLLFLLIVISGVAQAQGYLRAQGQHIVNERGERILLRGVGLGGWMLQEGYMLRLGNLGQQHVIRAKIEALVGAEATAAFYQAWLANHTTKADIDAMARWGFNSVRLPMHYNLYTLPVEQEPVAGQDTWLEQGFALTDQLIAWARANNLYVILDLHAAPGGQGNDLPISDRNPDTPSLWQSEANRQKTIALWRKLAQRYANEPAVGGYDIINEPNWGFENPEDKNGCKETQNQPLRQLLVDITRAIREVDDKHMIIIEGNCWGNNYAGILPPWDKNLVLSFHKYWNYNQLADIQGHLDLREKYNMPLWLGEAGENSNLWFTDAIRLVESQGIGWAWWPLKKIGFNNPLEIQPNADYWKLVDYWQGKAERPTPAVAKKALMQLATHDLRYEHNRIHTDVVDAMLRQPHSAMTIPFKAHRITRRGGKIAAVDFDVGLSGHAYWDKDSANYHVSTGSERMPWNRGRVYRNEGVDIAHDDKRKAYYVNHIEAGEWLEYTIEVDKAAHYTISASVRAAVAESRLGVRVNQVEQVEQALAASADWYNQVLGVVELQQGTNKVRVQTSTGGFELLSLGIGAVR
ncbi:cellulase family glycosylhydrolase [Cellvibrio japonicus]|uniref:Cellulase, putative, cel5G n=1 Tax=Cellvibrio japonicus (strain Ueda107) TaxID=498211 RepID=B3PBJ3_CELJU|nr:cellulase family glycosylhydrolase [Cellvibrio japonicus]ACE83242.1 cellulase, putative, cel5G [Cellvibrio japonicus Ueda107]